MVTINSLPKGATKMTPKLKRVWVASSEQNASVKSIASEEKIVPGTVIRYLADAIQLTKTYPSKEYKDRLLGDSQLSGNMMNIIMNTIANEMDHSLSNLKNAVGMRCDDFTRYSQNDQYNQP